MGFPDRFGGSWWISCEHNAINAMRRDLSYDDSIVERSSAGKDVFRSVRCLAD